jgi:hypothetical protein
VKLAVEINHAIAEEVEGLRAAGMKGVQRIRVKDKDYDIDVDTFKTQKDRGEWVKDCHTSLSWGCAAVPRLSAGPERVGGTRRTSF